MAKREIPEINAGSMADIAFLLLIFFLVTTTMDKDTAYKRQIPKLVEVLIPPVPIENRNICEIAANNQNQLLFRGENMTDPDLISEKIIEFYTMNENLTQSEASVLVGDQSYKGYDFPFYSYVTKSELEDAVKNAEAELEKYENMDGVTQDLIDFKAKTLDDWIEKQSAMKLYGKSVLPEIHYQAHIRVVVQQQTQYELFAKIQSEIEEALYELRNKAALDIFGETYGIIKSREAMDKKDEAKDGRKLKLLSILYPDRIIEVKPN